VGPSAIFEIGGPNIRTPGGSQITGNYDRHGFTYGVPASEDGHGTQIVMVLLNKETVRLTRRPKPGSDASRRADAERQVRCLWSWRNSIIAGR
jgi:hypothetical protein